jgi:hypothetical protein
VSGLLFAAALVLFSTQAAAGPQAGRVKQTRHPVWNLAMDGARVAYMTADRRVASGTWPRARPR